MIKLKTLLSEGQRVVDGILTIYQGRNVYNKDSKYFTIEKEWAKQFTQSGQEREITVAKIDSRVIYEEQPLPQATNEKMLEKTIEVARAKNQGYKAIWVDEGIREPRSIFIIDMNAIKIVKPSIIKESIDVKKLRDITEDFRQSLIKKYPQLQELYFGIQVGNVLHISSIKVKLEVRHQGVGSNVIREIKKFAKKHKLVITLSREPERGHKKNLERFYKNLGFVDNKGRKKDYRYASFFGSTMYHKPHINEGAILLHKQDKDELSKYLKDMDRLINKQYLDIKKPVDADVLIDYMNKTSDVLMAKHPFKIEYVFYSGKTSGFYTKDKITLVVSKVCRWRIQGIKTGDKPFIFKCYNVNFDKLSSTLIHEFVHWIQDVYRREKSGDYELPSDWSIPGKYYKRGWEQQAFALGYLEQLKKELNIKKPEEILSQLKKMGVLHNDDLNKLKKSDYKSWKAIMKQAIMATMADIKEK